MIILYFASLIIDFVVMGLMVKAAITDMRERIIPDEVNKGILICTLIMCVISQKTSLIERLIGFIIVATFMVIVNILWKDAFGGGDIKLMATTGAYYGSKIIVKGAIYGILFSGLYGIILLLFKKKNMSDRFALGPFLVAGIIFALSR